MIERIKNEVLRYFPQKVREEIVNQAGPELKNLQELRVRINKNILLKTSVRDMEVADTVIDREIINKIFEGICGNSVYAYVDEISNGFITVLGGHRVGITGRPLYKDGKVYNIKDISSLNFRVAREVIGAADELINQVKINGVFVNTLIISEPGVGKTTLLRDLIRQISDLGNEVSVIDERSEIAACFRGVPQNDVGRRTDVMDGVSKVDGIRMMVRAMRPDFIATDEIGTDEDADAIMYAINSGVGVIATSHGKGIEDLKRSKKLKQIVDEGVFEKIVTLGKNNFIVKDFI